MPLRYLNRSFARNVLMPLYAEAQACLVTPLRDGMNLVAKEYVAAQDPEDPGVLILSLLAGAALEMKEALLVNPHDTEAVAEALHTALAMNRAERQSRWRSAWDAIAGASPEGWGEEFLHQLAAMPVAGPGLTLYYSPVNDETDGEVQVCLPVQVSEAADPGRLSEGTVLDQLPGMQAASEALGVRMRAALEDMATRVEHIGEVRGLGPMLALEIVRDRETKTPAPELVAGAIAKAREQGVLLLGCGLYGNVLRLLPPLSITDEELSRGLEVIEASLS